MDALFCLFHMRVLIAGVAGILYALTLLRVLCDGCSSVFSCASVDSWGGWYMLCPHTSPCMWATLYDKGQQLFLWKVTSLSLLGR